MNQQEVRKPSGEETLAAENEFLRAKVRELEGRLEAAAAAEAALDRFFATVSHELRTPLAAMTLWIKLLEEQNEPDPARWQEGLEAIRTCAEEQQKLIDDLMGRRRSEIARAAAGGLENPDLGKSKEPKKAPA